MWKKTVSVLTVVTVIATSITIIPMDKTQAKAAIVNGQITASADVRSVYVDTGGAEITKETKTPATITIVDKQGGDSYEDPGITYSTISADGTIKVRGNTTSYADKKPFNIAFSSKQNIFGMGSAKKWCLLANAFDKSLMRNKLAMEFSKELGIQYTSESTYVDLYIDGEYRGCYQLIEAVEEGSTRVNIDSEGGSDILLEREAERWEEGQTYLTTSRYKVRFVTNEPEGLDPESEQFANTASYLNDFETALASNDYNSISSYIDMDSFVNYYILNEFFKNVDFNFSSTRFYIKDGMMYAGPPWDLDLSSGNLKSTYYRDYYNNGVSYKGFYCLAFPWFKQLMTNPTFKSKVIERYAEVQPAIRNMYNGTTGNSITALLNTYGTVFERNYAPKTEGGAGWPISQADSEDHYSYAQEGQWQSVSETAEFLRAWLKQRNSYLVKQFSIFEETQNYVMLNQENGVVTATWNDVNDKTNLLGYKVFYVAYDTQTKTATQKVTNLITNGNSYTFEDELANDTEPTVVAYYNDSTSEVIESAYALADLTISDIMLAAPVEAGQMATFNLAIKNEGVAVAEPSGEVISATLKVNGSQVHFNIGYKGPLSAGDSYTGLPMNWLVTAPGTYTITGFIDERRMVEEKDELNNTLDKQFTFEGEVEEPTTEEQTQPNEVIDVDVSANVYDRGSTEYNAVRNNMTGTTAQINGVQYNNYTRFNGISANATTGNASVGIDGNLDSRWESVHGVDPQEYVVDLKNVYSVKALSLVWETASAAQYKVLISEDGVTYKEAATVTSSLGERADELVFDRELDARYIKIKGLTRTTVYGYSFYELAVYGSQAYNPNQEEPTTEEPTTEPETGTAIDVSVSTNVYDNGSDGYNAVKNSITGTTAEISGVLYNNYARNSGVSANATSGNANLGIDANIDSRWESAHGIDAQEYIVDLQEVSPIRALSIVWETASAAQYKVLVSEDGVVYSEVTTVTSSLGIRADELVFDSEVNARYVKIKGLTRTTGYGYSFYELAIYGTDEYVQNTDMDWTKLTRLDVNGNVYVSDSNGVKADVYYKIIGTTNDSVDYASIISEANGYNEGWIQFQTNAVSGLVDSSSIFAAASGITTDDNDFTSSAAIAAFGNGFFQLSTTGTSTFRINRSNTIRVTTGDETLYIAFWSVPVGSMLPNE